MAASAPKEPDHIAQIDRMLEVVGTKKDKELAAALEIKPQSLSLARKRESVPLAWFVTIAEKYNVSVDWLIYGEGKKTRDHGLHVRESLAPIEISLDDLPQRLRAIREALGDPKPEEMDRRLSIRKGLWKALENGSAEMTPGFPGGLQSILNINVDWLITGRGPIFIDRAPEGRKTVPIQEARLEAFRQWIYEVSEDDPNMWGWINMELIRQFPDFADWLKKQEGATPKNSKTPARNAS